MFSCSADKAQQIENDRVVGIRFDAVVDGNLSFCRYIVTNEYELYVSIEDYYESAGSDAPIFPVAGDVIKIDMNDAEINEFKTIVDKLDHKCTTHLSQSLYLENVPYIYIEFKNGDNGFFIYGEPDNKAFDQLVGFCIDRTTAVITREGLGYWEEFEPYPLKPEWFVEESADLIIPLS